MQANIVIGGVIIWLFGGNLRDEGHAEMTLEKLGQIFGINYDTSSNNGIRIWKGMPCITTHILVICVGGSRPLNCFLYIYIYIF
jgi:hypothetical protein